MSVTIIFIFLTSFFPLSRPKCLLLFQKFVRRMEGRERKIVYVQMFERAASLGALFCRQLRFVCLIFFVSIFYAQRCRNT